MPETAAITFDEAKRCPRCGNPGEETSSRRAANGDGTAHTIICRTEACRWYNTGWVIQVKRDGTIPVRDSGPRGMDKDFVPLTPDQQANAARFWEEQDLWENRK